MDKKLEELLRPVIKYMNTKYHPHTKIIVEPDGYELVEGIEKNIIDDYILD